MSEERRSLRFAGLVVVALLLSTGRAAFAGDPNRARRFHVSLRAGGFDEQGSAGMLRGDGAPGNPRVGWKGSEQFGAALGFEVRPGLTLDLSAIRLQFDIGSDLLGAEPGEEVVTSRIATGDLDEWRLAVWLDAALLGDDPSYFLGPGRKPRGRVALAILGAVTKARSLETADAGREQLGVESVGTGTQSALGLGARMDYRFRGTPLSVGANLGWMFQVGGDLFTVNTAPDSPYLGTRLGHEGLDFLVDVSYHF